jgi:WD40 repeat protein
MEDVMRPNFKTYLNVCVDNGHSQLRDLLACPISRREFFCVRGRAVICSNTKDLHTYTVFPALSYSPVALAVNGSGVFACTGKSGQVTLHANPTREVVHGRAGTQILNSAILGPAADTLAVSSNDGSISLLTVPQLFLFKSIHVGWPVNALAASADGRFVAAVGDSLHVRLYDGRTWEATAVHANALTAEGYSVAWNATSTHYAVATDDGIVSVWDIRSSRRLAALRREEDRQMGVPYRQPARCIKYSQGGSMDLLAIAEDANTCTVIDARTYQYGTSLILRGAANGEGRLREKINGIAFAPDGRSLFVGTALRVLEYDVHTRQRRTFPSVDLPPPIPLY